MFILNYTLFFVCLFLGTKAQKTNLTADFFFVCLFFVQANTAVFEACSKERIQPFDDDEEDIWEEKEINYATQAKSRNR